MSAVFRIISQHSGKVFDIKDGSNNVNAEIVQYAERDKDVCIAFKLCHGYVSVYQIVF